MRDHGSIGLFREWCFGEEFGYECLGLFLFCFCLVRGEKVASAQDFGQQSKGEDHFGSWFPFFSRACCFFSQTTFYSYYFLFSSFFFFSYLLFFLFPPFPFFKLFIICSFPLSPFFFPIGKGRADEGAHYLFTSNHKVNE